ncbi:MAG: Smr/MutS family protein, partial [Myxococcaceae bacterium]
AHMDPRFINARVGFDARKMAPTYRLQLGVAGASSAIEIAQRMGLPAGICARARELAVGSGGALSKALASLEDERRTIGEELERARKAADGAEARMVEVELQRQELEREKNEAIVKHREELQAVMKSTQDELRAMAAALRESTSQRQLTEAQQALAAKVERADQEERERKAAALRAQEPDRAPDLQVGGWVHHVGLGREVEILEINEEQALVAAGPLKTRVRVSELVASRVQKPAARFPEKDKRRASLKNASAVAPSAAVKPLPKCDLRGKRTDDAIREVESFLDANLRSGEESAILLHGHGTGALKQGLRDYLSGSPYARSFRPGESHEGGDGVTVVMLRQ